MEASEFSQLSRKVESLLSKQWFFIVGFEKSGTTWLQRLFDAHPDAVCLGEGHLISCVAKPLHNLALQLRHVVKESNEHVYNNENLSYEPIGQNVFQAAALMLGFGTVCRDIPDNISFIGEKTPSNMKYMKEVSHFFPNARYVHIVRDGRDTLVSYVNHMRRSDSSREYSYTESVNYIANEWHSRVKMAADFVEANPERAIQIHYESLLSDPDATLASMHQFIGLSSDEASRAKQLESCSFDKLSGGRKQGQDDSSSFFRKGVAGDWKNVLSEEEIAQFEAIAGEQLTRNGYKLATSGAPASTAVTS